MSEGSKVRVGNFDVTDIYGGSGQQAFDQNEQQQAAGLLNFGRGKFYNQIFGLKGKSPLDTALYKANIARTAATKRAIDEDYTYDPARPDALGDSSRDIAKQRADIAGQTDFLGALAGLQSGMFQNRRQEKFRKAEDQIALLRDAADRRAKMQQVTPHQSLFSKIFSAAAPFLSMIPIPGMQALGPIASAATHAAIGGAMSGMTGGSPQGQIPDNLGDYNPPGGGYG